MIIGEFVTIKRVVIGTGLVIKNGEIVSVEKDFVKVFCYEDNKELKYDIKAFLKGIEEDNIIVSEEVILGVQLAKEQEKDKTEEGYHEITSPQIKEYVANYKFTKPLKASFFKGYGTNSREIYKRCVELFDWDIGDARFFGHERPCFSERSTPESYDVWMLAHSNWTDSQGGAWKNIICTDEIVQKSENRGLPTNKKRVVFAKTQQGWYVFLGLYVHNETITTKEKGKTFYIERYKKVFSDYPLKSK